VNIVDNPPGFDRFDNAKYWTDTEVDKALDALRKGHLVLLKGDIGYGLFGTSKRAIRKMYEIKNRPFSNPCIVIGNMDVLRDVAVLDSSPIEAWIAEQAAWTTLAVVLPVNPRSRSLGALPPWLYQQTVTRNTIAVFLRTGPYLDIVVERAFDRGMSFVGSSANHSSTGNRFDFTELPQNIVDNVDFLINHGSCKYVNPERKATTILNFTNWSVKRRGVNWEELEPSFLALKAQLDTHAE